MPLLEENENTTNTNPTLQDKRSKIKCFNYFVLVIGVTVGCVGLYSEIEELFFKEKVEVKT